MSVDVAELGLQVNARAGIQQNEAYDASLRRTTKTAMSLQGVLAQLGITISAGLTLRKVIQETSEAEHALSQLAAGIASTGGVAGRSMEDLVRLSEEIQATTKFSDEAAMGVEAMLLTFTKIRGAEFDDAVRAIADMGTRLGGIEGASLQVGKALNDPILGVTALGRAGVQFTESQKQMIEKLVEAGDVMGAQRVILSELETQFGGSARAARDTLGGSIEYLKNQFGDFFELTSEGSGEFQDAIESMGDAIPALRTALVGFLGDVQVAGADAAVRMGHFAATFADMKRSVVEFIGEWAEFLHINPPALQSWIKDVKDEAFEAHRNLKFLEEVAADVISALGADAPKAEAFVATIDEVADAAARAASELSTLYTAVAAGAEQARAAAELEEFGRQILVRAAGEEAQARLAFIFERNRREQEVHEEALIREARAAEVTTEVWEDAAESIHDALKRAFKGSAEDAILAFSDLARDLVGVFDDASKEMASLMKADAAATFEELSKIAGLVASAGAGFAIGQKSGSAAGVVGGAASGFAVAGPWGALAGGVAGFVSGLFASNEELERARKEWEQTLEDFVGMFDSRTHLENHLRALDDAFAGSIEMAAAAADVSTSMRSIAEARAFLARYRDTDFPGEKIDQFRDEIIKLVDAYKDNEKAARALVEAEAARFREDLGVRLLRAQGFDDEADALALAIEQEREYAEAVEAGYDKLTLTRLKEVQAAEALAAAAEEAAEETERLAEALRSQIVDLHSRGLDLVGRGDDAERVRLRARQRNEMEDVDDALRPLMSLVHTLETFTFEMRIQFERDREAIEAGFEASIENFDQMIEVQTAQLETAREELRAQEEAVDSLREVAESLRAFGDDLILSDLSPLSPTAKLAEARRQFQDALGLARGGDADAALSIPALGRALLEASRDVNASGLGFGQDFSFVQSVVDELADAAETQLTVEERVLAELEQQTVDITESIEALEALKIQAREDADRQIEALQENFDRMLEPFGRIIDVLALVADVQTRVTPTSDVVDAVESVEGVLRETAVQTINRLERIEAAVDRLERTIYTSRTEAAV